MSLSVVSSSNNKKLFFELLNIINTINNVSLIIDYPWYFMVLCLLLGVVYAFILYLFRLRKASERSFSRRLTVGLFLLRTLSVGAIAFLFLSPLLRRETNRKEKPIVIIAEDNSQSLDYSPDSAFYHDTFQEDMQHLADAMASDFEVVRYRYGSSVTSDDSESPQPLFADKTTDMAEVLSTVMERYYHRNVGALILTGDGIYNKGQNPLNVGGLSFPVYTVAMGDTTVRRDASVANVRTNRIAYLGNSFPMEVTVNASRLKGERSTLTVRRDGKTLFSKVIAFDNNRFSTTESLMIDADRAGMHNYVVEIAPLNDEQTTRNNRRVVPVEVIDGHQKIAIIYAVPHPDVGALRRSVEQNQNYEVEAFTARDFKGNVRDYDLLILHQLPSKVTEANGDVAAWLKEGTPALFVLGSQSDLSRLNALHAGLEIFARIDRMNEVYAVSSSDFTYFTLSDDARQQLEKFPPLLSPFGEYRLGGNGQKLLSARVGSVNSGLPLVSVAQQGDRRYAFVAGEGLWRWRLADYQANQSYDHFDELMDKLVVFTSLRVNKERFHVTVDHVFSETAPVVMEAQLYNDNYELVNSPDVELTIRRQADSEGDSPEAAKRYLFNRTASGYAINMGTLAPGTYSYTASTHFNGKTYSASGSFLVENLHLEAMQLVADHSLLATLSDATGGAMVEAHEVGRLEKMLKERDDMKTLIYSETRYSDMLNLPWIFGLLILLLTAEWVIRKYNGEI